MKIKHVATIVFVSDVARTTALYRDILVRSVTEDHDTVVMLEPGFEIHDDPDGHIVEIGDPH